MPDKSSESAEKSPWNSLEIAKLVVGVLTPIMIALLGWMLTVEGRVQAENSAATARMQAIEAAAYDKVVEKRAQLWDRMAVPLNDIYAYMLQVGHWKDLTDRDIVARKRQTDAVVYANRPYFSDQFFTAYNEYMDSVFATYGEVGKDARLRTNIEFQITGDEARFTGEDNRAAVHEAYYDLLEIVADELNLKIQRPKLPPTRFRAGLGTVEVEGFEWKDRRSPRDRAGPAMPPG